MHNPNAKSSTSISDFEILNKLGKGSFGIVYKVKRKSNKNTYVLKQINISSMRSKMRSIALNEVKILSSLENPYVVKYYDSFIEKDNLNIVMEYCEGGDLSQYIKSHLGKSISEQKIWKFFIQMCIGLRYIHGKKILHRDIKSLNIFLTKDGDIRIGDLGVAKVLAESVNFAHTMVGTPYYLSPEMCEEKPYNEKSDIWALGCVLYELCAQKHPFSAHSQGTLVLKIIKGYYSPIPGTYSSDLAEIVNLCLNKDYKKRPTASALLTKPNVIEKAKALNITIPEQDTKQLPITNFNPLLEKPNANKEIKNKENNQANQNKEVQVAKNNLPIRAEKIEKKQKDQENNEGKINLIVKNEIQKVDIRGSPSNKAANENKISANDAKNVPIKTELQKPEWAKINFEIKAQPVNEKPEINPPKVNLLQKPRESPLVPELVAKVSNDGKKPAYIVVSGEKPVNKEAPTANKEERNVQRVRKGAPDELSRQARNAGVQQKLVKKVSAEPAKINRPKLLDDKEKPPIQKKSPESTKNSQKNINDEQNVELTEEEKNEVKNLPDFIRVNQPAKQIVDTPQSFNVFLKDPAKAGPNFKQAYLQKPASVVKVEKPAVVNNVPSLQSQGVSSQKIPTISEVQPKQPQEFVHKEEAKISEKQQRKIEVQGAIKESKKEEIEVKNEIILPEKKQIEEYKEEEHEKQEEEPQHEDYQQENDNEENEEENMDVKHEVQEGDENNEYDKQDEEETQDDDGANKETEEDFSSKEMNFGYQAFCRNNWKISDEERNAKIVRKGDNKSAAISSEKQPIEEYKTFEFELSHKDVEENQPQEEDNEEEEEEVDYYGKIKEEENEESSEENEEEPQEVPQEVAVEKTVDVDKQAIEKKLQKSIKKRDKIQDLVKEIRSNKFIKSLGEEKFGEIINFFRLKLESDDEINEEDQDEIDNFVRGKIPAQLQVEIIYDIYRLLGLQIELQKCEDDIKKYSASLA